MATAGKDTLTVAALAALVALALVARAPAQTTDSDSDPSLDPTDPTYGKQCVRENKPGLCLSVTKCFENGTIERGGEIIDSFLRSLPNPLTECGKGQWCCFIAETTPSSKPPIPTLPSQDPTYGKQCVSEGKSGLCLKDNECYENNKSAIGGGIIDSNVRSLATECGKDLLCCYPEGKSESTPSSEPPTPTSLPSQDQTYGQPCVSEGKSGLCLKDNECYENNKSAIGIIDSNVRECGKDLLCCYPEGKSESTPSSEPPTPTSLPSQGMNGDNGTTWMHFHYSKVKFSKVETHRAWLTQKRGAGRRAPPL